MATVYAMDAIEQQKAGTARIFHQFLESMYSVEQVFGQGKGIYTIWVDTKFNEVTDEIQQGYDVRKKAFKVFHYSTRKLELYWRDVVRELINPRKHAAYFEVNNYIVLNRQDLTRVREEVVNKFMPEIIAGFKRPEFRKYVLENPSDRMLKAGICALTYNQQR